MPTPTTGLPAPGARIRVTGISDPTDEPTLYEGATGRVLSQPESASFLRQAVLVDWDDAEIGDVALLVNVDAWEVIDGG